MLGCTGVLMPADSFAKVEQAFSLVLASEGRVDSHVWAPPTQVQFLVFCSDVSDRDYVVIHVGSDCVCVCWRASPCVHC